MRFLDYQKVKDLERRNAVELFGTETDPSQLAAKVRNPLSMGVFFVPPLTASSLDNGCQI